MNRFNFIIVALAAGLGGMACRSGEQVEERCHAVRQELKDCLGSEVAQLDCELVGSEDLDRIASSVSLCEQLGGVLPGDGDPLGAACRLAGIGCVSSHTPAPVHQPTRYPIVLVNGIDSSPLFNWSDRIAQVLRQRGGHDVHFATLPPYEPPRLRAPALWQRISEVVAATGAERVNLICHSLGGLDCRYLVSPGGAHWDLDVDQATIAASVASITTVGTAHRGTPVADALVGAIPGGDRGRVIAEYAGVVGDWFTAEALEADPKLRQAIAALTTAQAEAFNLEITDAEGIYYQSWAGFSAPFGAAPATWAAELEPLCRPSEGGYGLAFFAGAHDYMSLTLAPFFELAGRSTRAWPAEEGALVPNDGLAPVPSTPWGNFRGCIPADHQEQLGKQNLPDVNVRTGLDIAWFYADVARDLSERGL